MNSFKKICRATQFFPQRKQLHCGPSELAMLRFIFQTLPLSFFQFFRLLLFVVCLAPGFARFSWYYFIVADRVSVPYGNESIRQRVDVYRTSIQTNNQTLLGGEFEESCSSAPVVIFCTGGGWMIGYKMWSALLARALTAAGIVVVTPDMRNFPMVYVPEMVEDIDLAIGWTRDNIAQYGGDPNNIVVIGQSAGGHVACMAIFRKIQRKLFREKAMLESNAMSEPESGRKQQWMDKGWSASDLKGFSAISSPLSLGPPMKESFERIGFHDDLVHRMFGFQKEKYDPLLMLENLGSEDEKEQFAKELPPMSIYQGLEDKTVAHQVSEAFYRELHQIKSDVSYVPYTNWSHTDPILEGPMDGDHRLHKDLFDDVNNWSTSPDLTWPVDDPRVHQKLCPHFLVQIARFLNPF